MITLESNEFSFLDIHILNFEKRAFSGLKVIGIQIHLKKEAKSERQ